MKIFAPGYYKSFKCIADKCKHNCCIGWEIDIDEDTYEIYRAHTGALADKFASCIKNDGESRCFILGEDERCPFLNEKGLCDIYIHLGEECLSDICTDHPRFRNFFSDRTEIGLGLCCEEAAGLILSTVDGDAEVLLDDDGGSETATEEEKAFFDFRRRLMDIISDNGVSVTDKLDIAIKDFGVSLPQISAERWAEFFKTLELMDEQWTECLEVLAGSQSSIEEFPGKVSDNAQMQNLLKYFLYRHLPDGLYDASVPERVSFAVLSVCVIAAISVLGDKPVGEIARLYSAEIEYSDENIELILDFIVNGR